MNATEALIADLKKWSCDTKVPMKAQLVMLEAIGRLTAVPEGRRINPLVMAQEFYELCQAYRHAGHDPADQVETWAMMKEYILAHSELPQEKTMWVSKSEWESVQRRLKLLEDQSTTPTGTYITVYDPRYKDHFYYCPVPSQRINIETVLRRVLVKLGMELKYVVGEPAHVRIDEPSAADESKEGK